MQTSFVTVGNYPGIEARVYGSKGALICRLVEEDGICETLQGGHARPGGVPRARGPGAFLSARRQPARVVAHALLRQPGQQLHRRDPERRRPTNEGNFDDGAWVQEVINAVEQSFRERRWVVAAAGPTADARTLDRFFESYYRLRPVNATFTGVHDTIIGCRTGRPMASASAVDEMRALRVDARRGAPGPRRSLHDVAERDRQLAIAFLDVQIAEHESGHFQRGNPSLAAGEAIFGVIALMTRAFAPVAERAGAARSRA